MMVIRFRSMEDLGPKQEKTAGWELVRLLRFDVNQDEQVGDDDQWSLTMLITVEMMMTVKTKVVTMVIDMKYSQGG